MRNDREYLIRRSLIMPPVVLSLISAIEKHGRMSLLEGGKAKARPTCESTDRRTNTRSYRLISSRLKSRGATAYSWDFPQDEFGVRQQYVSDGKWLLFPAI